MSGGIRRVIGSTVPRIQRYLKELPEYKTHLDDEEELEEERSKIILERRKIYNATNLLQAKSDEWSQVITNLVAVGKQEEADRDTALFEAWTDERKEYKFLNVLQDGLDMVEVLQGKIDEIDRRLESKKSFTQRKVCFQSTGPKLPELPLPHFKGDMKEW